MNRKESDMEHKDSVIDSLLLLDLKERALEQLVVWLKAKGLYEEACAAVPLLPPPKTTNNTEKKNGTR